MATNKNAQLRYQILDRCFSNFQKRYEIDDLLDEVNEHLLDIFGTTVRTRQIREDIKYMRDRVSFNAPIVAYPYDGKKCYYLEEVISNLEYRFGLKANAEHLVSFEQNEQLKGIEHLADIIDATINHQTQEIVYLTFRGKEIQMTIHPYYVKQYNGRWFLYGLNDERNEISNLALDRIQSYKMSEIPFKKNEQIDFSTYFDDVMGATMRPLVCNSLPIAILTLCPSLFTSHRKSLTNQTALWKSKFVPRGNLTNSFFPSFQTLKCSIQNGTSSE